MLGIYRVSAQVRVTVRIEVSVRLLAPVWVRIRIR
jgi:hypothetical protein